jgi:stringent starvation protein B
MSPTQPLPPKKDVALALLERSSVYVHLDPRQVSVVVPPWFKKQPQLVLQIGLNMHVPIPDLRLDDDGMSCTLSFNRSPFYCVVPWGSVFAMVGDDGRGMVWPEDVPAEVARQVRVVDGGARKDSPKAVAQEPEPKVDGPKPKRARKRPVLAALSGAEKEVPVKAVKTARVAERGLEGSPAQAPAGPMTAEKAHGPAIAQAPAARLDAAGARKKKRRKELPPYLRVVK